MFNISSKIERKYNWLTADKASKIIAIAKKHNADSVKRLAQERGALGYCKVLVQFNKNSWASSLEASKPFFKEIEENASELVNSLTYQN